MSRQIAINTLTIQEKMKLMEELWSDLSNTPSDYLPPQWHGDILLERRENIIKDRESYTEWGKAKEEIKKEIKKMS